jgi:hypothetical protein
MGTTGIKLFDLLNTDVTKLLVPKEEIALDKKRIDRKFARYCPPIGSSKLECQ